MKTLISFFKNEDGATAIEYGLIAALLSVVIIGTLTAIGGELDKTYVEVKEGLEAGNAQAD